MSGFDTIRYEVDDGIAAITLAPLASVQGQALGAGFQLALAGDLRVAAGDVRFGMLEARYGLIRTSAACTTLPAWSVRLEPKSWSGRLARSRPRRRGGWDWSTRWGPQDLLRIARDLLRASTAHSPVALALTKELIRRVFGRPLEDEMDREAVAQATAVAGAGNPTG